MVSQPAVGPLKTASAIPTQKVTAGGLGGAISVIIIAVFQHFLKWNIDPTLASAITTVVSFGVAYIVPPSARDVPVSRLTDLPSVTPSGTAGQPATQSTAQSTAESEAQALEDE
jgi:hypothetical protein